MSAIKHGTYGGYQHHRRLKETPCDDCTLAAATYMRAYRQRTDSRDVRRNQYARNHALREFRRMAPDLYARLYREGARTWESQHPARDDQKVSTP